MNAILFLLTPGESMTKLSDLVDKLVEFERLYDEDALMKDMLPSIYAANEEKYKGYNIKRLCAEMHNFYKDRKVNILQRRLFAKDYLPEYVMDPHEANAELVRGHGELVPLCEAQGRVALEGRFRIRLEFFVNSREKDGLKQRLSISLPLKKASICFRASHLKFRGFIWKIRQMERRRRLGMC